MSKVNFLSALMLLGTVSPASADEVKELRELVEVLWERVDRLEETLAAYGQQSEQSQSSLQRVQSQMETMAKEVGSARERMESQETFGEFLEGWKLGAGATFIYQTTDQANGDSLSSSGEDVGDASYSIDLELEKGWAEWGTAYLHIETGDGAGVEDELKVFSNVNRDADDSNNALNVTEIWYEHTQDSLVFTFGKLDPAIYIDTNAYANDETTQFLGRIFRNSPTLEFPDNSGGVRLALAPTDWLQLDTLALDGDSDFEDFFEDGFMSGQIQLNTSLSGHPGHYRLLGWWSERGHTRWENRTDIKQEAFGFGLSLDQEGTQGLGLFARYAWQDPRHFLNGTDFSLEHSLSGGAQISGELWGRSDDVFGLAIGQVIPSRDYKKADTSRRGRTEGHAEAYYRIQVNPHIAVSPDVQVIWNPLGKDAPLGDDTIIVGGVRSQVDF